MSGNVGLAHRLTASIPVSDEARQRLRDYVAVVGIVRAHRVLRVSPETLWGAMTGARFRVSTVARLENAIEEYGK